MLLCLSFYGLALGASASWLVSLWCVVRMFLMLGRGDHTYTHLGCSFGAPNTRA